MDRDMLKRYLKAGIYGGIAAVFISMIGMVETFAGRSLIVGVISVGHTLLAIVMVVTGYLTASTNAKQLAHTQSKGSAPSRRSLFLSGVLAGVVCGICLAILVAVANLINLRTVLVNVSPSLLDLLSLGVGGLAGAIVPLIAGIVLAGLGGWMFLLPERPRRVLVVALGGFVFFGLMADVIRVSLSALPPSVLRVFLTTRGFRPLGAAVIITLLVLATILYVRYGWRVRDRYDDLPPIRKRTAKYVLWGLLFVVLLVLPWIVGRVPSDVLVTVGIFMLLGFGLNIVVGKAGLLDLGYVAFFAVGAYATAVLTSADELPNLTLSFWMALPLVIIITGIAGLLVGAPVLRMRGDYLAIVTLGFGEIARFLALSDWFSPVLGGAQGIVKIPDAGVAGVSIVGPQMLYYLILLFAAVALFISYRLEGSRVGRAWVAMREDESVAEVMGVNTIYYKLLAFAMGAMIASLGGAVFAVKLSAIFPHSFNVEVSITALSLLIIGGLGSLPGVVVGALVLVGLPELLREFEEYRLLIYGAVLIAMMLLRPQGLIPAVRRGRELTEEERAQDVVMPVTAPVAIPGETEPSQ
jgi:branched-chain amino acid transport system permease protein